MSARRLAAVVAAGALAALTACTGGGAPAANGPTGSSNADGGGASGAPATTAAAAPAVELAVAPKSGSDGVSPTSPVTVTAKNGTVETVTLKNADGKQVKGEFSADHTSWKASEPLGYSKGYSLTAAGKNADGKAASARSSFTTVTPGNFTMPYFGALENGGTYGVGMPITVHFDEAVPDRAAAEKALVVTTSTHQAGAWSWISAQDVHWRPKLSPGHYWTPGTKVSVKANVYGVDLGEGLYGQADKSLSFTIGRSQIAVVDDSTHMMTAYVDGKVAKKIPVSMGRGGSITVNGNLIEFWTQSGPHVVMEKYAVREMDSSSYGLPVDSPLGYKEKIPLATRISGGGEFVHAADWNIPDQGVRNTSHGCINVSPANARWFYDTFRYGDIVDVRGTARKLPESDGLGDWTVSWDTWLENSALKGK